MPGACLRLCALLALFACVCDASENFKVVLSVRGCPISVRRVGSVKAGRFVASPIFCIADANSLDNPTVRYDPVADREFLTFPVLVNDPSLLPDTERKLRDLLGDAAVMEPLEFDKVVEVRIETTTPSTIFEPLSFLWSPAETSGSVRLGCNRFTCHALQWYMRSRQLAAFDRLRLMAQVVDSEPSNFSISVANETRPIEELQGWSSKSKNCVPPVHFTDLLVGPCRVRVHRRQDRDRQFLLEPLLCSVRQSRSVYDYNSGEKFVSIRANLKDERIARNVTEKLKKLTSQSPASVTFMELWNGSVNLFNEEVRLRLTPDRAQAELRLNFSETYLTALERAPADFWQSSSWQPTYHYGNGCLMHSRRPQAARRLTQAKEVVGLGVRSRWNFDFLRSKVVTRGSRRFIIFQQRGCSNTVSFQRLWKEYEEGFGNSLNFWLGLSNINALSRQGVTMRVELKTWNLTEIFAEYSNFRVEDASKNYSMSYRARANHSHSYHSLKNSNGSQFSTMDRDNDGHASYQYCTPYWAGGAGWWFGNGCGYVNPNGIYHEGEILSSSRYNFWYINKWVNLMESRFMLELTGVYEKLL